MENMRNDILLPPDWNPKLRADRVMEALSDVCLPKVKGAHDADFVIVGDKAYIVYEANDVRVGHGVPGHADYCALSIVNAADGSLERAVTFAASEMRYENERLPVGRCFVPRVIQKDDATLRCFFASQNPGERQDQTWWIDFDLGAGEFDWRIHPMRLRTDKGVFPMQPQYFHAHAAAKGFRRPPCDHGMYMFDSFKRFDEKTYTALNNFPGGQNALATLNEDMDTVTVVGDFFLPHEAKLTEAAVNRLPNGEWIAISRRSDGDCNYMFARSRDGKEWTPHEHWDLVPNGASSKPTFDKFGGVYYLGWQEATRIADAPRSVFNVEVSRDGAAWERKYRFETERSFQYPTFKEYGEAIYLSVTQGTPGLGGTGRILFGKLEDLER